MRSDNLASKSLSSVRSVSSCHLLTFHLKSSVIGPKGGAASGCCRQALSVALSVCSGIMSIVCFIFQDELSIIITYLCLFALLFLYVTLKLPLASSYQHKSAVRGKNISRLLWSPCFSVSYMYVFLLCLDMGKLYFYPSF